jgi:hypothetical protein
MNVAQQTHPNFSVGNRIDRTVVYLTADDRRPIHNNAVVRHLKIQDQRHGVVDVRRYNSTLMGTLGEYTRSRYEKVGQGVTSLYGDMDYANSAGGMFLEKHSWGDALSPDRDGVVDIPLSDLTDLARTDEPRLWPTAMTGETTFELEMENPAAFTAVPRDGGFGDTDTYNLDGAPAAGETTFRLTRIFRDLTQTPLYVGQPVVISYDNAGDAAGYQTHITELDWDVDNEDTYEIVVTVATALPNAATDGSAQIHPYSFDPPGVVPALDPGFLQETGVAYVRVELQMTRVMNGKIPKSISYMTYRLHDLSMSAQENYTTTVTVPSDRTPNLFLMWLNGASLLSVQDAVEGYRISIDDEYEGPPVYFGTSAHRELIMRGFRNAGMSLRDLTELLPVTNATAPGVKYNRARAGTQLKMAVVPLHIKPKGENDHVVQLELAYNGAGNRRLLIYGQQVSTLVLSEMGIDSGPGPAL